MQNKGMIRLFAVLLALVCLFQLSFSFVSWKIGNDAERASNGNEAQKQAYLDSISSQSVYLGYTYKQLKGREINLGLDLRGGMNVTLEISVVDLIKSMAGNTNDPIFNQALAKAKEDQKNSTEDYITLFGRAYEELDPNGKLAAFFISRETKDLIDFGSSNEEVLDVLKKEADGAIDNSFNILRSRIDRFGVSQPNIQKLPQRGRILVELPGVKEKERVRNLLQGTASLEFWETYENSEIIPFIMEANNIIKERDLAIDSVANAATEAENVDILGEETTEAVADSGKTASLLDEMSQSVDSAATTDVDNSNEYPLFKVLQPSLSAQGQAYPGPVIGMARAADTSKVNAYLAIPEVRGIFPHNVIFCWTLKPISEKSEVFQLIALKSTTRDGKAPLDGSAITDARQDFSQTQASEAEVDMTMNSEGAKTWARITKENVGRSVAIVLDGYVVSFPTVRDEITGGRSNISGSFTVEEAKDLANMLKSGKMPAPATIVEEYVVGPSLGQESINSGLWSFVIAFILVLIFMMFMYSTNAGGVANIALICNLFLLIGVLASFGAVLTLPGIAGIVLTLGMAVDANVLIYERIQEEVRSGKTLKLAIKNGYNNAYSAIIDGQVTTLLTGIVLFFFGSGPIKGFATTLIIGILTSLFSSIFITRLVFERVLSKEGRNIKFVTKMTENWLKNISFDFIEKRKKFYIVAAVAILIALGSMVIKGFDWGIDFVGGRTYVIEFKQDVKVGEVASLVSKEFGTTPQVKTYGGDNQVRMTIDYMVDSDDPNVDNQIEEKLYASLTSLIGSDVDYDNFTTNYIKSSTKVGPTISEDIKRDAFISIFLALIAIFLYIFVRFRNWQYGLGGIVALAHDSIIILGMFSLFSGILPFSLEIDQTFIAAILTVLGYSINDTVIIFDRIREFVGLHPKRKLRDNMNNAISSTLRRTFNTSISTAVVLLAIFIFGGESIRGFAFALLIGVVVGTFSTIFVATPIAYDTQKKRLAKLEAEEEAAK